MNGPVSGGRFNRQTAWDADRSTARPGHAMTKKERQSKLDRRHVLYCDFGQKEGDYDRYMAENAHPAANDYRRLRAVFDRLRYCCNHGARILAYKDDQNSVEYWKPGLDVTNQPTAPLERYSGIYPAHRGWPEYLQAAARDGWPAGCEPQLDTGSLLVITTDSRLVGRLFVAADGFRVEKKNGLWEARIRPATASQMLECVRVVGQHWRKWTPPARSDEQDAADTAPLPVAQRKFCFGNVDEVTLTDRHLLVPLIPAGSASQQVSKQIATIATDLINICRSEEYPYFGPVRDWLMRVLSQDMLMKMDKEFRAAA